MGSSRGEALTPLRLGTCTYLILSTPLTWIPCNLQVGYRWGPNQSHESPGLLGMLRAAAALRHLLCTSGRGLCALHCTEALLLAVSVDAGTARPSA